MQRVAAVLVIVIAGAAHPVVGASATSQGALRGPGELVLPVVSDISFRGSRSRGTIAVSLLIDREGKADDLDVLWGIDVSTDARILRALRSARHQPAMHDGQAVDWRMTFALQLDFGPQPAPAIDHGTNRVRPIGMLIEHASLASHRDELRALGEALGSERGWVLVGVRVDKQGSVSQADLLTGFHPALDAVVLEEVRAFTFEPARIGDRPVAWGLTVRYPIAWRF